VVGFVRQPSQFALPERWQHWTVTAAVPIQFAEVIRHGASTLDSVLAVRDGKVSRRVAASRWWDSGRD